MTKKEKIAVLKAIREDVRATSEKELNAMQLQYNKGKADALDMAIAVLSNNEYGNEIKQVYLGKEVR